MSVDVTHLQLVLCGMAEPETTPELHALLLARADAIAKSPIERALLMEAISHVSIDDYRETKATCIPLMRQ